MENIAALLPEWNKTNQKCLWRWRVSEVLEWFSTAPWCLPGATVSFRNGAAVGINRSGIWLSSDCSVWVERAETAFLWVFNEAITSRVWWLFGVLNAIFRSTVHFPANACLAQNHKKGSITSNLDKISDQKTVTTAPRSNKISKHGPSFLSVRLGDYRGTSGGIQS